MHLHLWRVFLLSSSLAPSAPVLLLLRFTLTHEYLTLQCQPQSSALWSAPQQDPVTPSMTSWSSLRYVSWKPTESKLFFFFYFFDTSKEWTYSSRYIVLAATSGNIWLISLNIFLFPATSLLLWTTEVGCPATARSSYIRSDHVLSFILDWQTRKISFCMFVFSFQCEEINQSMLE